MVSELRETIPTFGQVAESGESEASLSNWSAMTSAGFARSWIEAMAIVLLAVVVVGGIELYVQVRDVPAYSFPAPSEIGQALWENFDLFWPHLKATLRVMFAGYAIGAAIGIVLAAVITQFPFVEK